MQTATANDTYQNSDREIPSFLPLASGGVTLPQADPTYELPQLNAKRTRGYSSAFNTISDYQKFFLTQFDGERIDCLYGCTSRAITSNKLSVY